MKRIARWARELGIARAVCILLLFALVPLRIADPLPIEELRLRTFDLFQLMRPREQKTRPVIIVDIDEAGPSSYRSKRGPGSALGASPLGAGHLALNT